MLGAIIGAAVAVALLLGFLYLSVRVVREYQRNVVFRLGRCIGTKGPGIIFLIPVIDRPVLVDLREQYLEIPRQTAITKDNAPISIDFIVFHRVIDAVDSVVKIQDFAGAAENIASTTLRSVVGDMALDDVLSKRDQMNSVLQAKLDEVTERWGVKITNVELREITPPPDVQEAMTRQMSAERTRRAVVTEAEGAKQAAVTVAEGNKAAAILNAEGQKQAAILSAEGERQAAILRAEGFSLALDKINEVATAVAGNTMTLQYLDTLRQIGSSPSSKIVVPTELAGLAAGVVALVEGVSGDGKPREAPS